MVQKARLDEIYKKLQVVSNFQSIQYLEILMLFGENRVRMIR